MCGKNDQAALGTVDEIGNDCHNPLALVVEFVQLAGIVRTGGVVSAAVV